VRRAAFSARPSANPDRSPQHVLRRQGRELGDAQRDTYVLSEHSDVRRDDALEAQGQQGRRRSVLKKRLLLGSRRHGCSPFQRALLTPWTYIWALHYPPRTNRILFNPWTNLQIVFFLRMP
jgi:hypothetical protein